MHRRWRAGVSILLLALLVVSGCGPKPAPTALPTAAPTQPSATAAPPTARPTKGPPAATATPVPTPSNAATGGTLVWAIAEEPDTLDPQLTGSAASGLVLTLLGDALIARDPNTGRYVPYLAESWTISDDGLNWEFKLRKDVKFHDGSPALAADWVFTLMRFLDPSLRAPLAGLFAPLAEARAADDYTLQLTLKEPYAPMLPLMASTGRTGVYPQAAIQQTGAQFGRAPIGTGPFKFEEWLNGASITLGRNPDYKWAPAFTKGGPYIDTVVYKVIPDPAARVAGMEAGEIDLMPVRPADLEQIKGTGNAAILEYAQAGGSPSMLFNCSKPPFNDVRVRQAFLYAIDRDAAIKDVALGQAEAQHLPTSRTMTGWWEEGEKTLGYNYDPGKAKALLQDAGYSPGSDGFFQKGGEPLTVTLHTGPDTRLAGLLSQQFEQIGVQVGIKSLDWAKALADIASGNYDFSTFTYLSGDFDQIVAVCGTSAIDGMDLEQARDRELDSLLLATRTTVDPDKRQVAMEAAQKYILDKAYIGPLYAPRAFWGVNSRVKGLYVSPVTTEIWLTDAYIKEK
jgi:peptide/nickel transport system substrate-binding protein